MEILTCECGSLSLQETYANKWLEPKNRLHPDSLRVLKSVGMPERIPVAWRAAVEDYSRMDLTCPADMLQAISGISKTVMEATNWTYVAGLWKENLLTDLMWNTINAKVAARSKIWRAPTFSWASIMNIGPKDRPDRAHISYELLVFLRNGLDESNKAWRTDFYASVVDTSCVPVDKDVTGQLTSGFIVLRGTLIAADLCRIASRTYNEWQIVPIGGQHLESSFLYPDISLDRTEHGFEGTTRVYCLKLVGTSKYVSDSRREYLLYLVLRNATPEDSYPQPSRGSHTFERIALYRDARDPDEGQLEDISGESNIERDALVNVV